MRRGKRPARQISDREQRIIEILSTDPDLHTHQAEFSSSQARAQIPRDPFQGEQAFDMKAEG